MRNWRTEKFLRICICHGGAIISSTEDSQYIRQISYNFTLNRITRINRADTILFYLSTVLDAYQDSRAEENIFVQYSGSRMNDPEAILPKCKLTKRKASSVKNTFKNGSFHKNSHSKGGGLNLNVNKKRRNIDNRVYKGGKERTIHGFPYPPLLGPLNCLPTFE